MTMIGYLVYSGYGPAMESKRVFPVGGLGS